MSSLLIPPHWNFVYIKFLQALLSFTWNSPTSIWLSWLPVVPHNLVVLTDVAVSTTILSVYPPPGYLYHHCLDSCHQCPGSLQCSIGFLILVYLSDSRIPKILPHWIAGLSRPVGLILIHFTCQCRHPSVIFFIFWLLHTWWFRTFVPVITKLLHV